MINHQGDITITDSDAASMSQIDIGQRLSEINLEESKKREIRRMTEMAEPHIGDRSEVIEVPE